MVTMLFPNLPRQNNQELHNAKQHINNTFRFTSALVKVPGNILTTTEYSNNYFTTLLQDRYQNVVFLSIVFQANLLSTTTARSSLNSYYQTKLIRSTEGFDSRQVPHMTSFQTETAMKTWNKSIYSIGY